MSITSSKLISPIFAERVHGDVRPNTSYTLTTSWANATGYYFTVPVTGRYRVKMQGSVRCANNGSYNYAYIRLYNNTLGSVVSGSPRRYGIAIGAATSVDIHQNIAGDWEENFTAGHVIYLQGYTDDASVSPQIRYQAGATEPILSYELIQQSVSVRNASEDYFTSETDTGKNWINGNRIYRKVINFGALPNATSKSVAHGIASIGAMISMNGVMTGATYIQPIPFVHTTASGSVMLWVDTTNVTLNTGADYSSYTGYIILEYTE